MTMTPAAERAAMPAAISEPTPGSTAAARGQTMRRVAIACRFGAAAREAASGLVAQLGFEPVVLGEPEVGHGRLIGRLDGLPELDFAIIALAADAPVATPAALLEIGFLLGRLGAGRICFLLEGQPALAPDLDGVARHTLDDAGVWRLLLARAMKQAGLDVDLNRAL